MHVTSQLGAVGSASYVFDSQSYLPFVLESVVSSVSQFRKKKIDKCFEVL